LWDEWPRFIESEWIRLIIRFIVRWMIKIYCRWMIKIYWRWMIKIFHEIYLCRHRRWMIKIYWRWMIKIFHKIYLCRHRRWMIKIYWHKKIVQSDLRIVPITPWWQRSPRKKSYPYEKNTVLITPHIEMMRHGDNYKILDEPMNVSVVSCAAPDLNNKRFE
jgi:hypothetical protein